MRWPEQRSHTFTVTASYPFGGTSAPVTVTVDIENP